MTWRGYLYTAFVVLTGLIALLLIGAGLLPASDEFDTLVAKLDDALREENWHRAEQDLAKLKDLWNRSRLVVGLDTGEDNMEEFETALENLGVEIEERRRSEARVYVSTLRVILPKLL